MKNKNTQSVRERQRNRLADILSDCGIAGNDIVAEKAIWECFDDTFATQAAAILADMEAMSVLKSLPKPHPEYRAGYQEAKEEAQAIVKKHLI